MPPELYFCQLCLESIFPFNRIKDDVEFQTIISGYRYAYNFDYAELLTIRAGLDVTIKEVQCEADVDGFYYAQLTPLMTKCLHSHGLNAQFVSAKISSQSLQYINARSLKTNHGTIMIELSQLIFKFSIIGITETWTRQNDQEMESIPGYDNLLKSRYSVRGGRVGLLINKEIFLPMQ